ncbi:12013_t:CDS:2, partial [Gigaspora rosea]
SSFAPYWSYEAVKFLYDNHHMNPKYQVKIHLKEKEHKCCIAVLKNITDKFAKEWKKAIEISKVGKKPSLLKALDRTIGWHVLVLAVYKTYRQLSTINITFSNANFLSPRNMEKQSYSDIHNRMFDASSKTVDPPSALKRLILSTFLFLILTASTFFTQWSSPIWYYGAYYLNN